jgi:ribosome-binding protein aMBF1 (putative translation factor)
MNSIEKLRSELARAERASTWSERIDTLKTRRKNPLDQGEFCKKYDLKESVLSRRKSGHGVPSEPLFNKVEAALAAEGV